MKKEEHKQLLEKLQKATTDAERMECIIQLDQDYNGVLKERDDAITNLGIVTAEKNKFAELNTKLWLENSAQVEEQKHIDIDLHKSNEEQDEPPQKMGYGELENKFEQEFEEE